MFLKTPSEVERQVSLLIPQLCRPALPAAVKRIMPSPCQILDKALQTDTKSETMENSGIDRLHAVMKNEKRGAVAQLEEYLNGIQGVVGSNPISSTI